MCLKKTAMLLTAAAMLLTNCAGSPPRRSLPTGAAPARPFLDARFHPEAAEGDGSVRLDLSCASEGYAAASAVSSKRQKLLVSRGGEEYIYELPGDGTPLLVPLSCGSGEYRFRVMEELANERYAERYRASCEVDLLDEFQPFLRPSVYVPYREDSLCVQKARELAAASGSARETAEAICDYICRAVRYDAEKAASVAPGYLPDPDETLRSGKGICLDYAALAASMLRSQGIPAKLVVGYVLPEGSYHAWNMFYIPESGRTGPEAGRGGWRRMDATFAACGADASFIAAAGHYAPLFSY